MNETAAPTGSIRLALNRMAALSLLAPDADDAPNITIEQDGAGIDSGAAVADTDDGVYTYTVEPGTLDTLGILEVQWSLGDETVADWREVVSHHVCSLASIQARLDAPDNYTVADLAYARDVATYAIEDACHTAFARRRRTDQFHERGKHQLLSYAQQPTIFGATARGLALTDDAVAGIGVGSGGLVLSTRPLDAPGTITYAYGWPQTPPRVARAVAMLAAEWIRENVGDVGVPARATMIDSDAGNIRLVTAGEFGRGFDVPEVNAVVQDYAE